MKWLLLTAFLVLSAVLHDCHCGDQRNALATACRHKAASDTVFLADSLGAGERENGRPASSEASARALDELPIDPWGRPYRYAAPGELDDRPHVYTFGADGERGGHGEACDICSCGTIDDVEHTRCPAIGAG